MTKWTYCIELFLFECGTNHHHDSDERLRMFKVSLNGSVSH